MTAVRPPPAGTASRGLAAVVAGLCYFATAYVSLVLTQGPDGIATMWPADGLLLAVLLRSAPRIGAQLAAAAVASFAANWLAGASLRIAAAFSIANLFEPALAAVLLRAALGGQPIAFVRARHLAVFCAVCIAASCAGAIAAAALSDRVGAAFLASWFATDLLGLLIVTPILLIAWQSWSERSAARRPRDRARIVEAALVTALLLGVTLATFAQSSYAAFFLPMAVMLLAVFRLGIMGAALGVLAIAAISSTLTAFGIGPIMLLDASPVARIQFLQIYLLTLFAAALPVAALLDQRKRLIDELAEKNQLLSYAETAAGLGHWRLTLASRRVVLSDELHRIFGVPAAPSIALREALDPYHPEDAPRVRAVMAVAVAGGRPFEFRARVVRPDGSQRHVVARGECERDGAGRIVGAFGMVQDVTREAEDALTLEQARLTAEQAAQAARTIADTDPLTGLPNRRMALRVLEAALDEAAHGGDPLSIGLLDIDHFKLVNDHHGHGVGDAVLRHIARSIAAALRATDLVGRYGGEEFLLVLPNSTGTTAAAIAERVREAIEGAVEAPRGLRTTASIGVATLDCGETLDALLRRADAALYEAKSAGRNRVRVALPAGNAFAVEEVMLSPVAQR